MSIRLVATDLDGTLLRSDGSVSDRTRKALQAVEESGRALVFVTGRPPRWMHPVAEATGHTGLAICSNGALRYDLHDEQIVGTRPLAPETMLTIAARLREAMPEVSFGAEYGMQFGMEEESVRRFDVVAPIIGPLEEILARPAVKMLARNDSLAPQELLELANEVAGDLATFTYSGSDSLLEISVHGVTKASGLEAYAEEQGIVAAEVLAFGDMPNDIALLTWAGRSIAVANAHHTVHEVADEVTKTNDEDGVAVVLERLLS